MNNIILCGFMGAGKTVVGRELAKVTGRRFIDTDEWIERQQGMAIEAIFAVRGEDYFRELEHEACKDISALKNCIVSTGGGALTFERNVKAFKGKDKIVFLDASFDTICDRIGEGTSRPLFRDKEQAKALYDARKGLYEAAADYVADGDMSARKTALMLSQLVKK